MLVIKGLLVSMETKRMTMSNSFSFFCQSVESQEDGGSYPTSTVVKEKVIIVTASSFEGCVLMPRRKTILLRWTKKLFVVEGKSAEESSNIHLFFFQEKFY